MSVLSVVAKKLADGKEVREKIKAYHGSPHDFDKFSSDNIGSGEGAQAYGRGLYFAERKGTAESYRDSLTSRDAEYEDWLMRQYKDAESGQDYARMEMYERAMMHDKPNDLRDLAKDTDYDEGYRALADEVADEIDDFTKADGTKPNFGKMYEVDIDASPDELLDYDTLLKDQPKAIQDKVFSAMKANLDETVTEADVKLFDELVADFPELDPLKGTLKQQKSLRDTLLESNGAQVMGMFASHNPKNQANLMRNAGIKGVKYADAQTRFSSKGKTHNYVIFDDNLIKISRKYGVTIPAMARGNS